SAGGTPANNIARWNGSSWSPLGTGISGSLVALAALPTGDLVAAGWFTSAGGVAANGIARWDGANWSALGGGITGGAGFTGCSALFVLPNGDLAAAASYNLVPSGTVVANTVSRWNGSVWSTMASGISGSVYAMQMTALGELAIGGSFPIAGGHVTGPLARLSSTCPATVASFGAGCTGTGGLNTLRALTLPWLGSTYRAIAAGIAPNSLAIGVHGLGQVSLPLLSVLPTAGPGCSLFVSPDVLALLVPTGTTVQDQLTVPATAALVGQRVQHQVVPLVFDVSGNLSAVTSTNALSLTIGSF
ncbi:MAG TPA: hypothetical protein VFZ65_18340, partial [Planctomycetota bacterium]|nr:hypothetical protein [Planctomycetota bacterium]